MKYYIYKLECQGHTNHVIADENGPDYKCKSTRCDEILMSSEPDEKAKQLRLAGDFQFSMCLFQGCTYYYFRSLALAMHIPPKKLRSRLIRYRLWLEPWPKDLVEFVNGEPLPHLRFIRKTHSDNTQVLNTHENTKREFFSMNPRAPGVDDPRDFIY